MTNTHLNPDDEARLKKALEQSANGQVVGRGSFAQYAQTPLNPEYEDDCIETVRRFAIGSAQWIEATPLVTSLEELDAMPDGSVVKDSVGEVYIMTPYDEFWRVWGNGKRFASEAIVLPARVIDLPEVKP